MYRPHERIAVPHSLALVRDHEAAFCLILLDHMMPDMNEWQLRLEHMN